VVFVKFSHYGESFLFVNTYWIKLFFISLIYFFVIFVSDFEGLSLFTKNGLMFFAVADALIAAMSYLFLEDFDPVGYYLSLYWTAFAFIISLDFMPFVPKTVYSFTLSYIMFYPVIFSLFNGTVFMTTRYALGKSVFKEKFQGTEISSYYKELEPQNLTMSVLYSALITADVLFYSKGIFYFLYPPVFMSILFLAFLASFFVIYLTYELAYNMTVVFIVLVSALPLIEYMQVISTVSFLKLMLVLTVASIIVYIIIFREQINPSTGEPTGAVVSTYQSDVIAIIVLLIVWIFFYKWIEFSLTSGTLLFIMLPVAIGSITSDTLHGHRSIKKIERLEGKREMSGSVGGVGMADGLWIPQIIILLLYLFIPVILKVY